MAMRRQLLLTTAAASLIVGGTIGTAQDRSTEDTMRSRPPSAAQSQQSKPDRSTNRDADKTTGRATSSDDRSQSDATPDRSKASTSGANGMDRNNNRADQKGSPAGENANGRNGRSAADSNDRKQPSAAQSSPSTERQPSNSAASQSRQPGAAQQSDTDRNAASSSRGAGNQSRDQANTSGRSGASTRLSASLQGADRTRLEHAIGKVDIKSVSSVNFSVSVGTAVPDNITLHPLPTEIIAILPQYRGYDFLVVKNEFVIVEPRTHNIVDVVERGGARAEATSTTRSKMNLSQKDRTYLREHAATRRTTTTGAAPRSERRITIGEDVPESIEIDSFSEDVYREVPAVRSYRYIHSGNDMYLVEPGSRRVIESIGDED
jgi:hypothetical protein